METNSLIASLSSLLQPFFSRSSFWASTAHPSQLQQLSGAVRLGEPPTADPGLPPTWPLCLGAQHCLLRRKTCLNATHRAQPQAPMEVTHITASAGLELPRLLRVAVFMIQLLLTAGRVFSFPFSDPTTSLTCALQSLKKRSSLPETAANLHHLLTRQSHWFRARSPTQQFSSAP